MSGGPLAAGYFFVKNFRVLGESEKVAPTWSISIISTICIFGGLSLIPDNVRIPNFVIPAAYTSVAYFLFKHYQAEKVERLLNSGAKEHGIWRVLGVVLINIAVLVTVGMIIFALVDIFTTIEE